MQKRTIDSVDPEISPIENEVKKQKDIYQVQKLDSNDFLKGKVRLLKPNAKEKLYSEITDEDYLWVPIQEMHGNPNLISVALSSFTPNKWKLIESLPNLKELLIWDIECPDEERLDKLLRKNTITSLRYDCDSCSDLYLNNLTDLGVLAIFKPKVVLPKLQSLSCHTFDGRHEQTGAVEEDFLMDFKKTPNLHFLETDYFQLKKSFKEKTIEEELPYLRHICIASQVDEDDVDDVTREIRDNIENIDRVEI